MDKFTGEKKPDPVTIRMKDPLNEAAKMLMNPEIVYGYKEHVHFIPFEMYAEEAEGKSVRLFGPLMSSRWAERTDAELLSRTLEIKKRATLLPIWLNADGVALAETNRSANTVMMSPGFFNDVLLQKVFSKACLGNDIMIQKFFITKCVFRIHALDADITRRTRKTSCRRSSIYSKPSQTSSVLFLTQRREKSR